MKSRKWLWVALLAGACAPAVTTNQSSQLSAGFPDRIVGRDAWLDQTTVPPRLRVAEMPVTGGYFVLYASSGRFCVVDAADWTAGPNNGELYSCQWRYPRGPR